MGRIAATLEPKANAAGKSRHSIHPTRNGNRSHPSRNMHAAKFSGGAGFEYVHVGRTRHPPAKLCAVLAYSAYISSSDPTSPTLTDYPLLCSHTLLSGKHTASIGRELAALQARLTTLGYQDGVDDGVQEAVQGGFDQGYAAGAVAGWETGLLYGSAAATRAALAASHDRLAMVGVAKPTNTDSASGTSTSEDDRGESCMGASAGSSAGVSHGVAGTALPEASSCRPSQAAGVSTSSPISTGTMGTTDDLQSLVEELRHASLLGPDGPGVPDRTDVLRRLRLVGPVGVAVSDALEDK